MAKSSRTVPENQFVAERLEALATMTPEEEAKSLRLAAVFYRADASKRMIRVSEVDDANQAPTHVPASRRRRR